MDGVTTYEEAAALFARYQSPQKRSHSPPLLLEASEVLAPKTESNNDTSTPEAPKTHDKHTPSERLTRR